MMKPLSEVSVPTKGSLVSQFYIYITNTSLFKLCKSRSYIIYLSLTG